MGRPSRLHVFSMITNLYDGELFLPTRFNLNFSIQLSIIYELMVLFSKTIIFKIIIKILGETLTKHSFN